MVHSFDPDVAKLVGVNAAVLFQNICYWIEKNKTNGTNYHDGAFWTYNSNRAFTEQFPYLSKKQIETSLEKLCSSNLIITGNYNAASYDRTKWYSLSEMGKSIFQGRGIHYPELGNPFPQNGEPIPDIKPDIKPNINIGQNPKRVLPPSLDEVTAYCSERHNGIDPEAFINFYESKGWFVGKNKMKDWKAAVRTWEAKSKADNPTPTEARPKRKWVATGEFDGYWEET